MDIDKTQNWRLGSISVQAIIFDLEGVIIDSERVWDLEAKEFLGRRGIAYDRDAIKHLCAGRSVFEVAGMLKERFGLSGTVEDLGIERMEIFRSFLRKELRFVPGFREFFREVEGRFRTAIATSMDGSILSEAVSSLGLSRLFGDRIYSISDVGGIAKPAPDLFLFAAKKLGIKPPRCLVIEDSPFGIEAAKRACMVSLGITTTFDEKTLGNADLVVDTFGDILPLFTRFS